MDKAVNKVILGNKTIMDVSEDTVSENNLLEGATAHAASGEKIVGKVVVAEIVDGLTDQSTDKALSAKQGYVLDQKITKPQFTSGDTTSPTKYQEVAALTNGNALSLILNKISLMFSNVRYLFKLIGSTDISEIGDGTLTGGLSTLNSSLIEKDKDFITKVYSKNFSTTAGAWTYGIINSNISIDGYTVVGLVVRQKDTSIAGGTDIFANMFGHYQLFYHCFSNSTFNVSIDVIVLYKKGKI